MNKIHSGRMITSAVMLAAALGTITATETTSAVYGDGVSDATQTVATAFGVVVGSGQAAPVKTLTEVQQFMSPGLKPAAAKAATDVPQVQVCKIRDASARGLPAAWRLITAKGSDLDKTLTSDGGYGYERDLARVSTLLQMTPNECGAVKFTAGNHWNVTGWGRVDAVSSFN